MVVYSYLHRSVGRERERDFGLCPPETPMPPKFIPAKLKKWVSKWPELKLIRSSYPEV